MSDTLQLSPEQRVVVETWGKGLAVMAGAGSGKTTTLVLKCAELLRKKPEARFAAVSFTERSASDLRAKLSAKLSLSGEGGALSGHWVMTIHGLCSAIIREFPREAGFDGDESMLSPAESMLLWERATDSIWADELPEEIQAALDRILLRESQTSVQGLLNRTRDLFSFGVLESLEKSGDPNSLALVQLSRFVLDRYDRLKRRRGVLDFNDLERGADRALEIPEIRESYQRRFDLVLVDEFQDTNPLQARIIKRFCKADSSNLCVVGDPKQSIYRFRDADVSVFEDFCSRLPIRQSLTWNFRSRPGIIDYANQVCEKAFDASDMAYEALVPKRDPGEDFDPVVRLDVKHPGELGAWIRSEMDRGVPLHEMALLLRKIRGNEKWLKALTASGIPIAVGSGGLFWEDARVREMMAFLRWWDNPGHSLSGAIFLRAPWVGIDDLTLDRWAKQDKTWQKPFFSAKHPMAQALEPYRGQVVRPAQLLLALLIDEKIEAELGASLLGLWHRCEELSSRGLDFHAVISEFSLAMEQGRRERDVPPPKNQGQLSVLTLHGSKGLEFPHVILIDFGKKQKAPHAPLLFWDREKGAYLGLRDESGERDKKNPQEVQWREMERKKDLAENKRVFYVALTRARERLVLVCPELEDLKYEPETVYLTDHWRGWLECAGADLPTVKAPEMSRAQTEVQASASQSLPVPRPQGRLVRPRHSVTEWNLLSRCARAYEWKYIRPVAVVEGVEEIGLFTGQKVSPSFEEEVSQQELGTRVHRCLEIGDYEGLKSLEQEVGADRFVSEPVISWALSSDWMAPSSPSKGRDVWAELSFEVPVAGEVLVGSVDRLVKEGSRYTLIDFKVTQKAKSVESLLGAYQTQIVLYAWALSRVEPAIRLKDDFQALLVNISSKTIQAVPVSLGDFSVESVAKNAAEIVAGKPGDPRPGTLCRMCEFRPHCAEGRATNL